MTHEETNAWKSGNANRIPTAIQMTVQLVGGGIHAQRHVSCYYYRFTEGFLEIVDPRGAGVVSRIERGLIRSVQLEAL